MIYSIYKLTSPSGRFYIGVTRNTVAERWGNHVKRSRLRNDNHPLYNAIRKYGADAFVVETLYTADTEEEALALEIETIAKTGANLDGYNISGGGEYDWQTGVKRLAELRKDPEFDKRYRAALSEGVRRSQASVSWLLSLREKAADWRRENPRLAWKLSSRASRIAARAKGSPRGVLRDPRFSKVSGRLWIGSEKVKIARSGLGRSDRTREQWASLSDADRKEMSAVISASIKNYHANKSEEDKAQHEAQLAKARSSIDHAKKVERIRAAFAARNALRDAGLTPEQKAKKERERERSRIKAREQYYAKKAARNASK